MATDCSLNHQFSTWKFQAQNIFCTQIVFCFILIFKRIYVHNMFWAWGKNKCFWKRFTCISFQYHFRIMVLLGLFLWCYQIDWTFRGHDIRYDHGWHVHFQYHLHNFPFWIYSSLLLLDQKHRSKFQVYRSTAFRDDGLIACMPSRTTDNLICSKHDWKMMMLSAWFGAVFLAWVERFIQRYIFDYPHLYVLWTKVTVHKVKFKKE